MQFLFQILVMKDGRISHQGTFDEICIADTGLCDTWSRELNPSGNDLVEADTETESDSDGTAERERRTLRQQVSREKARLQLAQISSRNEGDSESSKFS